MLNSHFFALPGKICNPTIGQIYVIGGEMKLTTENYTQGFLIDEELMGGVTPHPQNPGLFVGFVLRHTTGEYLGYEPYPTLEAALEAVNRVKRPWAFDQAGGCGNGNCGDGSCKGGACAVGAKIGAAKACSTGACPT